MADFIDSLPTQNSYVPTLQLGPALHVKRIDFSVLPIAGQTTAEPVLAEFWKYPVGPDGGPDPLQQPVLEGVERLYVGNTFGAIVRGAGGVKFRSAVAGSPATILAILSYANDLDIDAGNVSAAAVSSGGSTNPGGGVLAHAQNQLAADVLMTNANQFYDGPSLTLAAGTWLLSGAVTVDAGLGFNITAMLWDGTTAFASCEYDRSGNTSPPVCTLPLVAIVTLAAPATLRIAVATSTGGNKIKAAAPTNGPGNTASTLTAIQIG